MNSCIRCAADCGDDEFYCPFCDALYDVVEDGDLEMGRVGDGAPMTPEREQKIANAYRAYEELQERSGMFRDVELGDGNRWRRVG